MGIAGVPIRAEKPCNMQHQVAYSEEYCFSSGKKWAYIKGCYGLAKLKGELQNNPNISKLLDWVLEQRLKKKNVFN